MNIQQAKDSRSVRFMMRRVGLDPGMLDELESSQQDLLLMHTLMIRLVPDMHSTMHTEAENRNTHKDLGEMRETVVDGCCLVSMTKFLYAERFGIEGLNEAIGLFLADRQVKP